MKPLPISCPLAFLLSIVLSIAPVGTITAADAKNHIGERAAVCGKVASERTATNSRGEQTLINLDTADSNQAFAVLVWGDDRAIVEPLPHTGDRTCAEGLIERDRGGAEIVVRSSAQLSR